MGKAFSTFMALVAVYVWALPMGDFIKGSSDSGAARFLVYMAGLMFLFAVTDFLHAIYVDVYRTSARRFTVLVGFAALGLVIGAVGVFALPFEWNPFWVSILGILVFVVVEIVTSAYRVPTGHTSERSAHQAQSRIRGRRLR